MVQIIHKMLKPNKIYEVEIDMWNTSNLFKKSHDMFGDIKFLTFHVTIVILISWR